jgi:hypothetical protein
MDKVTILMMSPVIRSRIALIKNVLYIISMKTLTSMGVYLK